MKFETQLNEMERGSTLSVKFSKEVFTHVYFCSYYTINNMFLIHVHLHFKIILSLALAQNNFRLRLT